MKKLYKMKYDFYKNDIEQHAIVEWITVINDYYLVEDINTKNRLWVNKNDIIKIEDENI
jgi:guanylate kinase